MTKPSGTLRRERIVLVVDDDDDCRIILSYVLESAGYAVIAVDGGGEALALVSGGLRPLAMTLDLMMPGIDGISVLKELRAAPDLATIPVVVVSASLVGDRCPEGAFAALPKPLDVDALLDLLAELEVPPARTA